MLLSSPFIVPDAAVSFRATDGTPILSLGGGATSGDLAAHALALDAHGLPSSRAAGSLPVGDGTAYSPLAVGAAGTVLKSSGAAPLWGQVTDADVAAGAGIAWSKLSGVAGTGLNINSNTYLEVQRTAVGNAILVGRLPADTQYRVLLSVAGRLELGAGGTTARDTFVYRPAAETVRITNRLSVGTWIAIGSADTYTPPSGVALDLNSASAGAATYALRLTNSATLAAGGGVGVEFAASPAGAITVGRMRVESEGGSTATRLVWELLSASALAERMRLTSAGRLLMSGASDVARLSLPAGSGLQSDGIALGDVFAFPRGSLNLGISGASGGAATLSVTGTITASVAAQTGALTVGSAAKSAAYTFAAADHTIAADATAGPVTITLPTAIGAAGRVCRIRKSDASANAVTVACTAGQAIYSPAVPSGAATHALAARWDSVDVQSDGANWIVC